MDPEFLANAGKCCSIGHYECGSDVTFLGVVPTPLVSDFVRNNGCVSHSDFCKSQPYHDNGIKIFNSEGEKLNDEEELRSNNYSLITRR